MDPMDLCKWLTELRPSLARATWRFYRAAFVWFLQKQHLQTEAKFISEHDQSPCLRRTNKTSAKKLKGLPFKKFTKLLDALTNSASHEDKILALWLYAGFVTGLRPAEWAHADLDYKLLQVTNAKNTNGRSFAPRRTVDLSGCTNAEFEVVFDFLNIVKECGSFKNFYERYRQRLLRWNRALWKRAKKHISLYSARHQFAADIKASGASPATLAALMGHASILTAIRNYARKRVGRRRGGRVRPLNEDVDKVMALNPNPLPALPRQRSPTIQRKPARRTPRIAQRKRPL